jgi:hypothetical protein
MPWAGAGLAPSRLQAAAVRPIRLDFLGACPFCCKNLRFWVLDFLGFPWILSSESSLFNGLRGIKREKYFSGVSLALRGSRTGGGGQWHSEAQDCSWGELNLVSDFLQ